jgi:sulfatase modifying factor 1
MDKLRFNKVISRVLAITFLFLTACSQPSPISTVNTAGQVKAYFLKDNEDVNLWLSEGKNLIINSPLQGSIIITTADGKKPNLVHFLTDDEEFSLLVNLGEDGKAKNLLLNNSLFINIEKYDLENKTITFSLVFEKEDKKFLEIKMGQETLQKLKNISEIYNDSMLKGEPKQTVNALMNLVEIVSRVNGDISCALGSGTALESGSYNIPLAKNFCGTFIQNPVPAEKAAPLLTDLSDPTITCGKGENASCLAYYFAKNEEQQKLSSDFLKKYYSQSEPVSSTPAADVKNEMVLVEGNETVKNFYIAKYETTQKEYQELMGNNPSEFKGENLPVESLSWFDTLKYCNSRSKKEGLPPAYNEDSGEVINNMGYRLPTEAEYEYAAKGGKKSKGYKYAGGNNIDEVAWSLNNSLGSSHIVGTRKANELGLYDLNGNVWEWNQEVWPSTDARRIKRGGSWHNVIDSLKPSTFRGYHHPDEKHDYTGFRVVRSAE